MSTRTDTYPTTPPAAVATAPHHRRRTTLVALSVVTLLAIGAVVAVAQLANDGSGSLAHPSTAAARPPIPVNACGPEITHLLATVAALPPTVVASLSPELAAHLGRAVGAGLSVGSVSYNHTPNFPAPTTRTSDAYWPSSNSLTATPSWPPFPSTNSPQSPPPKPKPPTPSGPPVTSPRASNPQPFAEPPNGAHRQRRPVGPGTRPTRPEQLRRLCAPVP